MEQRSSIAPLCPSAQPDMAGSVAFGVVGGTAAEPRVVLRIAAACQEGACLHFDGGDCRLAKRLVQLLPAVTGSLPPCRIRAECRWFLQEGRAACYRCPQIVTYLMSPSEDLRRAALPA